MYLSYQDYIQHNGQIWPVNSTKSGIHTQAFKRWLDQLTAMFEAHSKVFVLRFDLSFPTDSLKSINNNIQFERFLTRLKKQTKNHYHSSKIGYSWASEIETSKHQHYHVVLMLNGHEVQSPKWLQSCIGRIWSDVGGSTPHWAGFYRLHRNGLLISPESLLMPSKELIGLVYQVSYLFKGRGKGYLDNNSHNYGHSRMRLK